MYQMVQYPALVDNTPKQRLLDAAIDYVAANGMSDVSLRTSPRRSAPVTGC